MRTLTENRLRNIVNNSVRRVLKEGRTIGELEQAKQILEGITESGFIPFSSPSPSSTEEKVKQSILNALDSIEDAIYYTQQLGY